MEQNTDFLRQAIELAYGHPRPMPGRPETKKPEQT